MDRITIIGLGLIGGSLGMALKASKLRDVEIVGCDISWDAVNLAKKKAAVDRTERSVAVATKDAHLIIVATPIAAIREVFQEIGPHLMEGCVVTDTGSTKGQVMEWGQQLLPVTVNFVGGHPMAGRETAGMEAASATLFQKATYCIVPAATAANQAVQLVVGLATTVGATPYFVGGEEHDMLVAGISHLPLVLSAALVATTSRSPSWDEMSKLAASGFESTSRLASSDVELSRGISLTNQPGLLRWLDGYLEVLQEYRTALVGDIEGFIARLSAAREAREKWLFSPDQRDRGGALRDLPSAGEQMAELFVGGRIAQAMRQNEDRLQQQERGGRARG